MLNIMILLHFFHLKSMLSNNLNRICVCILTLLLTFLISVFLPSSNFNSSGISSEFSWEERKFKKLWIQVECLTSFFGLLLTRLYFKHSFANNPFVEYLDSLANFTFFSMSSPVAEWWCAYSTLPFDDSRHDSIILVAVFLGYIYGFSLDMYINEIYFFNFVFIVFLIVIFLPKNWQQIWYNLSRYNLSRSLVWNPSAIVYNTN